MKKAIKETENLKDNTLHKGYNEKNPGQPQGAFVADSLEQNNNLPKKRKAVKKSA